MIDKLFYIIYNSYYKHGIYKDDTPPLTVFGIFTIAIFSVLSLIVHVINLINDKEFYIHKTPHLNERWYILGGAIATYFLFYFNKRYRSIYLKYKDDRSLDKKNVRIFAFIVVILLIFSNIIFAAIFQKYTTGHWMRFSWK